jgi:hypothetical protein
MQNRREACSVLGLKEEASSEDIESRYFLLLKKYKHLAHDERPSPEEPIFADINKAYRFLIGYTPLQKVQFRELAWRERLQYIRENFMMEITFGVVLIFVICAVGTGIHELYKALQTENIGVYSPADIPLPMSPDKTVSEKLSPKHE